MSVKVTWVRRGMGERAAAAKAGLGSIVAARTLTRWPAQAVAAVVFEPDPACLVEAGPVTPKLNERSSRGPLGKQPPAESGARGIAPQAAEVGGPSRRCDRPSGPR